MGFSLFGSKDKKDGDTLSTPSEFASSAIDSPALESLKPSISHSPADSLAVKQMISKEFALANANELITKATSNCFDICITNPGSSLTANDQKCLDGCTAKFLQSWNIVSQQYIARLQTERPNL